MMQLQLRPPTTKAGYPKFDEENIGKNLELVEEIKKIASEAVCVCKSDKTEHKLTTAQMSLAWVSNRGDDVVPIPGTVRVKSMEENCGARQMQISEDFQRALEAAADQNLGDRHINMKQTFK